METDYGIHIDVKYFQLTGINIPGDVEIRYMETLILLEKKLRSDLIQDAKVIRKDTDKLVSTCFKRCVTINIIVMYYYVKTFNIEMQIITFCPVRLVEGLILKCDA